MNDKFFSLPQEKQQAIINAGYTVFSQNSYKKSPMSEVADAAGISKALLFHYFRNKKEFYLFLWNVCAKITLESLMKQGCYEKSDLFEIMFEGLKAKISIIKRYPAMSAFVIKAHYEKDPEVCSEIQESSRKYISFSSNSKLMHIDKEQFIEGIDLEMMYHDMYWASEGYIFEKLSNGNLDFDQMEQDFIKMISFWKQLYLRKNSN